MTTTTSLISPPSIASPSSFEGSTLLKQLLDRRSLSTQQATELMQAWINEAIAPAMSGAILAALQAKSVSADELVGMVQALQPHIVNSEFGSSRSVDQPVVDTCGTGGDGASTFNISTAVAFVTAAAGVKVAKHGNRSASSKAGSADVLEALGLNLNASPEKVSEALDAVGITFLYAPGWHPAFKTVSGLRKTLKVRTIFNLLGPLLNPLQPTGQVVGVYHPDLVETIAIALCKLGLKRAVVVHGRENLDEAGLADFSELAIVEDNKIRLEAISPQMLGLDGATTQSLKGGNVNENAEILKAVLQGKGTPAQQQVVALNAALALYVGEVTEASDTTSTAGTESLKQGIRLATEVIKSGAAWTKLEQLSQFLAD
ncbi:MAG: anthranilate phosphoribosyltransferase [Cyanobacteria bacterium J06631_9]